MLPSIPLSAAAARLLARGTVGIEAIVAGGDDYEILCTVPEDRFEAFAQAARRAGVAVTSIGTVIAGQAFRGFWTRQGREIALQRACPTAISEDFGRKAAWRRFACKYLLEIDRLGPSRRCAGDAILAWSRRFEAALLGRAGLLFMRPPRPAAMAWGKSRI